MKILDTRFRHVFASPTGTFGPIPRGRRFLLACIAALFTCVSGLIAANLKRPPRFEDLFEPVTTDRASLSPDGKYIAYSVYRDHEVRVLVVDADHPGKVVTLVPILSDAGASFLRGNISMPARILWMEWLSPTRLVIQDNCFPPDSFIAIDADGKNPKRLVYPEILATLVSPPHGITHPRPQVPRLLSYQTSPNGYLGIYAVANLPSLQSRYSVYSVDIYRGTIHTLRESTHRLDLLPLLDRQGHVSVGVRTRTNTPKLPLAYLYRNKTTGEQWTALDHLTAFSQAIGFKLSPENYFGHRSIPVGFGQNPSILYFASNIGRNTFGLYGLNLQTGKPTSFACEDPRYDLVAPSLTGFPDPDPLILDRFTGRVLGIAYHGKMNTARWFIPSLQAIQSRLEATLPGRSIRLLDWDQHRTRFLVRAEGPADPGAFYLFEPTTGKLINFARREPTLDRHPIGATLPFTFTDRAGIKLDAIITVPRKARTVPVPLIVKCQNAPWERIPSAYDPEITALNEMGFAVLQVDPRGTWGTGIGSRETVGRQPFDRLQVDDILDALDYAGNHYPVSVKLVGILGHELGGWFAVRALELAPKRFRCAVALKPRLGLADWLKNGTWESARHKALLESLLTRPFFESEANTTVPSILNDTNQLGKPVFISAMRARRVGNRETQFTRAIHLAHAIRRQHIPATVFDYDEASQVPDWYPHAAQLPEMSVHVHAAEFRALEKFLNSYVYNFGGKLGKIEVIQTDVPTRKQ